MMMDMPADAAGMRKHLAAEPPDGHGVDTPPDATAADMTATHDTMHSADTAPSGHSHTGGRSIAPRDDLYRAMAGGVTSEDGRTLTVRLAPADQWAEINSKVEGHFMERFSRTAYKKTMADHLPKILFQHGKDPQIGDKPIATTDEVGEDEISPFARGTILEGVPPLVVDGLRKGVYGASHRFSVVREDWVQSPKYLPGGGLHNPDRLPERTITEAKLPELGPVTWPAYPSASVSLRSITDEMRVPTPDPVAPSLDAAAPPHLEPERRDEPETIAAPTPKETTPVDITQYKTRDEMSARRRELDPEIARMAELPGVLSNTDQGAWDEKTSERNALNAAIEAWDKRINYAEQIAENQDNRTAAYEPVASFSRKTETDIYDPVLQEPYRYRSTEQWAQAQRDNAMRAVEIAKYPHPDADVDKTRASIFRLIDSDSRDKELARRVLSTGSPTYLRAFAKFLQGRPMTVEEARAAAMTVQTDATGGFGVPFYFDPTLVHVGAWTSENPYRTNCRTIQISGTDTFHGVTAGAVTVTRAAEAAAVTEGGPAIGQITAIVGRVSGFVTISVEALEDRPNWTSDIASLISEAKDTEEESVFTLGVGDALGAGFNPIGVLAAHATAGAYTHVGTTTGNTLAIGDLYNVEAALPLRYRQNAQWFMGRATIRSIQALETTGGQLFGGQYYNAVGYPANSPTGNTGLRLLGYPVNEVPSAVTGLVDDYIIGALIDPKSYFIIDRIGMTVEVVPHIFGAGQGNLPTLQRGILAWWRNTAKPSNIDAGRQLAVTA